VLRIALIDYGLGNLRSIANSLRKNNAEPIITHNSNIVKKTDAIILPGVGAFKDAIKNIIPVKNIILEMVENGTPLLGICLGLQLLFTESTEGGKFKGLNLIKGRVIRLPTMVKVPHMGWNTINIISNNPLTENLNKNSYFYFVHSYYAEKVPKEKVIAYANYGVDFPAIVANNLVFATQFHPEKSDQNGLIIIKNFLKIVKGA
jgi:glutamine amidotransferase